MGTKAQKKHIYMCAHTRMRVLVENNFTNAPLSKGKVLHSLCNGSGIRPKVNPFNLFGVMPHNYPAKVGRNPASLERASVNTRVLRDFFTVFLPVSIRA